MGRVGPPEDNFIRVPWGGSGGGSREAGLIVSYAKLRKVLGEPDAYDEEGSKTAFMWVFKNARTKAMVAIYDYKATSLYDPEQLPPPEALKRLRGFEWSISAPNREQAELFLHALVRSTGGVPVR